MSGGLGNPLLGPILGKARAIAGTIKNIRCGDIAGRKAIPSMTGTLDA